MTLILHTSTESQSRRWSVLLNTTIITNTKVQLITLILHTTTDSQSRGRSVLLNTTNIINTTYYDRLTVTRAIDAEYITNNTNTKYY